LGLKLRPSRTVQIQDAAGATKRACEIARERGAIARTPRWTVLGAALISLLFFAANAVSAQAEVAWRIDPLTSSTTEPGATVDYVVSLTDTGDAAADPAHPYSFTAQFPPTLTLKEAPILRPFAGGGWQCPTAIPGSSELTCEATEPMSNWAAGTTF